MPADFITCVSDLVIVNIPPEYANYVFDDFTIYCQEVARLNKELKHFENMPSTESIIGQIGSLVRDRFKSWEQIGLIRKCERKIDLVFPPARLEEPMEPEVSFPNDPEGMLIHRENGWVRMDMPEKVFVELVDWIFGMAPTDKTSIKLMDWRNENIPKEQDKAK